MSLTSAREALKLEVESLPEDLAAEVLDFIEFMRQRRDEEAFLWQQAAAAESRMAARPDEVRTVTRFEWESLTKSPGA
jgi:hypothetical protein